MCAKICTLLILFLYIPICVISGETRASQYRRRHGNGTVVTGNLTATFQVVSAVECGAKCIEDDDCVSFNFGTEDGVCQLSSAGIGETTTATLNGYHHYERLLGKSPLQSTL